MGALTIGYILRRVGMFLLTIWLGTTLIFLIPRLSPGDPVQAMMGRMMTEGSNVENADQIIENGAGWRYPCKNLADDGEYCEL